MKNPAQDSPVRTRLVIGPNASLSVRQAWFFMGLLSAVSLSIGAAFAAIGLWPVLPFAGLELAAVGTALAVCLRRNAYREVLHFEAESIRIEVGRAGQGAEGIGYRRSLPRSRTRVLVEAGPFRNSPTRLLLAALGETVELGRCLTDADRERLAARMRELIHPGWRRAPAGPPDTDPAEVWNR